MVIAKKFPRNEVQAVNRILTACARKAVAENSQYVYKRGGTMIDGPSIRLAEVMAQNWGNMDYGLIELEQRNGESTMMAYAWDLETNTRQTRIFQVAHKRKAKDEIVELDDPRDIYELSANQGARRMRACILGVIPSYVKEEAMSACEKTMAGGKEPIVDRARKMVAAFGELGVTQEMIEAKIGHHLDAVIEQELVTLRKIYTSIKDGAGKREDFFDVVVSAKKPQVISRAMTNAVPVESKQAEPDGIPFDPAPAPTASTPTPVDPATTSFGKPTEFDSEQFKSLAHSQLFKLLESSSHTFSDLQEWCKESSFIKGADKWDGINSLESKDVNRLLNAKAGLIDALNKRSK